MKTLRLTKLESTAYSNGERRFWREVKTKRCKDSGVPLAPCEIAGEVNGGDYRLCPYGKPGDRIELVMRDCPGAVQATITKIEVTQRDGKWGWEIRV